MPNLKIVVWSAVGAAALSFLAGIVGRVTFGVIMLRMVLSGLVFGAFIYGMMLLLQKFIPELFSPLSESGTESEPAEDDDQAQSGKNLNIVIDGEETPFQEDSTEDSEAPAAYENDEEFIEEIQEGAEEEGESTVASSANPAREEVRTGATPPSEVQDFDEVADVDSLPDLEEFSDSFESVAASQEEDDSSSKKEYNSNEDVDILGSHHDSETIAKAVRTIIGRDQEG